MAVNAITPFSVVYDLFLSKITDDMYMELTELDTYRLLEELLLSAIPKFEFPSQPLRYNKDGDVARCCFVFGVVF